MEVGIFLNSLHDLVKVCIRYILLIDKITTNRKKEKIWKIYILNQTKATIWKKNTLFINKERFL